MPRLRHDSIGKILTHLGLAARAPPRELSLEHAAWPVITTTVLRQNRRACSDR